MPHRFHYQRSSIISAVFHQYIHKIRLLVGALLPPGERRRKGSCRSPGMGRSTARATLGTSPASHVTYQAVSPYSFHVACAEGGIVSCWSKCCSDDVDVVLSLAVQILRTRRLAGARASTALNLSHACARTSQSEEAEAPDSPQKLGAYLAAATTVRYPPDIPISRINL